MIKKQILLFFGNFYKAPFEQYDTAMRKMMKDPDYLYGSLIKDIYMLGCCTWAENIAYTNCILYFHDWHCSICCCICYCSFIF